MITTAAVRELAGRLSGPVLLPGDDGYAAEVAGFNRVVEHRPAAVAAVRDAAEIREAVGWAAAARIPVAVQATGHGPTATAHGDGLLISTRRMTGVTVDPDARTARVAAGTQWHEVIDAAAAFGLAPLNGSSPLVGVVGYTLGGGLGLLSRAHGYAADHVTAIEYVGADGRPGVATAERDTDLFWAMRGGKGNFAVVTALEFSLFPAPHFYGGGLYFPGEHAAEVLHTWRSWTAALPEETSSSLALLRMPDLPAIPEFLRSRLVVHVRVSHLGPADEAERLLKPLRQTVPPIADTLGEMPYARCAAIHHDPASPVPYHERTLMLREFDGPATGELLALAGPDSACGDILVELRHLQGALGRPPAVPNAVGHRDAAYCLTTLTPPGGEPDTVVEGMAHRGTGLRYLNFLTGPQTAQRASQGYDSATYTRLTEIKDRYDPENLLRFNHNIPPRAPRR
ncbi:Mitomycin radical oxidase [Streptomyces sp. RB5]|uniref:Mitomycin radical oxidase n=1 Tax=Streptomyces smaragdinus TaxID=2585196 RepID=A0A7K0C9F4_9ACTN|nr:bagremycin/ferroverdin biosynthesis FAD-dependent oxygenase BagK/FevA1 [Streptomyces smaragdinus]MQY10080.1 Mitomycin radical oxidase [Streptomyces smaragdinus]